MFRIVYRKTPLDSHCQIVLGQASTLEEARSRREVAGDLVVDARGKIVTDPSWFWDWEKADPKSYAQRAIRAQKEKPPT